MPSPNPSFLLAVFAIQFAVKKPAFEDEALIDIFGSFLVLCHFIWTKWIVFSPFHLKVIVLRLIQSSNDFFAPSRATTTVL